MKAVLWLFGLPWEILALAGIMAVTFWTAVLTRKLMRRDDMRNWQAFQQAMK